MYIYANEEDIVSTHKGSLAKMHIMGDIMAVSKNACSIMTVSWIFIIIVGRIYDFHVAYISFIEQTKSEEWLLEHCNCYHASEIFVDTAKCVCNTLSHSATLFNTLQQTTTH